jgi:hypothetical protein
MDYGAEREGEEEMLNIIGEGTGAEGDGSEFLNELGEGIYGGGAAARDGKK